MLFLILAKTKNVFKIRLSEHVVLKLIEPFESMSRNITLDYFFMSLQLAKKLKDKRTSLVGTTKTDEKCQIV